MIKLKDLLLEGTYNYGCVMLYFNFPEINKIHDAIDPKDLYEEEGDRTFGLEDKPHTTLLFGLHEEVTNEQVKEILNKYTFGNCEIYNASLFQNNDQYDVLKFDVNGPNLNSCNKELSKLPNTNDFPDYHPHMTIAYVIAGTGKRYTKMLEGQKFELLPSHAIYSKPNGEKVKIKVKIK